MISDLTNLLSLIKTTDINTLLIFVILCLIGVIYKDNRKIKKSTGEINTAVNHKKAEEPTLRQAVMETREKILEVGECQLQHMQATKKGFERINKKIANHDDRIVNLELSV